MERRLTMINETKKLGRIGDTQLRSFFVLTFILLLAGCDCEGSIATGAPCTIPTDCLTTEQCIDGRCRGNDPVDPSGSTCIEGVEGPGSLGECGNCDPTCRLDGSDKNPFDVELEPSEGVNVGEDGALRLDSQRVTTHFIWIANTGEGTVSKFDTRTYDEVARYVTGPNGSANDPSRTSVNSLGDVYIGNRSSHTITKISALGDECPDTNGDGSVTTSSGGEDVLAWGMDDCVLWNTPLPTAVNIRAVAAQDVEGLDYSLESSVWVGAFSDRKVWKLDGDTGEILVDTFSPIKNYGFALDRVGNLWISGLSDFSIGRIDTTQCTSTENCTVSTCETDDCIKQRIRMPHQTYGITVDVDQRVWVTNPNDRSVTRYDHSAPLDSRMVEASVEAGCHGIAADGAGWVWAACFGSGVLRIDGNDPSVSQLVAGTQSLSAKGMAVDFDQKVWAINLRHNSAIVIEPGPTLTEAAVTTDVATSIVSPYTYSDMTGQQLRLATNPRGYYRRVFEGCDGDPSSIVTWGDLSWVADIPPGTSLVFRVRTAADRAALDANEDWVVVAEVQPATSPTSLQAALVDAEIEPERFLEVEVIFQSTRASTSEVTTPVLHAFETSHFCTSRLD